MANILLPEIFDETRRVYSLLDLGKIDDAVSLTLELENRVTEYKDEFEADLCRRYVAPCLIDIGFAHSNKEMVLRGTKYLEEIWLKNKTINETTSDYFYNIANGYYAAWNMDASHALTEGIEAEEHKKARHFYRLTLEYQIFDENQIALISQAWTNYGNCLDAIGRCAEAIDAYDKALNLNPNMGMALGNKAIALIHIAPLMNGMVHRYYLEAYYLLEKSLAQKITPEAKVTFHQKLNWLKHLLEAHGDMEAEPVETLQPQNEFHKFICEFNARYGLFLNPVTMLGHEGKAVYSDPMFIERMIVPLDEKDKADRYVTFLNEIKQEYVLGRYFLAQSQYRLDELDVVDKGVVLVYPLDYSLHSIYIQLLKASIKQAISVLDKIAYFIYDYCKLTSPASDRVAFRQLWGGGTKLRKDLNKLKNPYLHALFSLSHDVAKNGDWSAIYEHRDALTHRFLVIHDLWLGDAQPNADIPRDKEGRFLNRAILATKIACAAYMYLILFVALEEEKLASSSTGIMLPMLMTEVDDIFRHHPPN
jgi:tetratricopeptide (TPR) repeat protein